VPVEQFRHLLRRRQGFLLGAALRYRFGPQGLNALHEAFQGWVIGQTAATDLRTQRLKKGAHPLRPGSGSRGYRDNVASRVFGWEIDRV
jgi:hypothetical protein